MAVSTLNMTGTWTASWSPLCAQRPKMNRASERFFRVSSTHRRFPLSGPSLTRAHRRGATAGVRCASSLAYTRTAVEVVLRLTYVLIISFLKSKNVFKDATQRISYFDLGGDGKRGG